MINFIYFWMLDEYGNYFRLDLSVNNVLQGVAQNKAILN
jgi:hypothetical protein